jgi:hypothetical protein
MIGYFIPLGAAIMAVGLAVLFRRAWVHSVLGMPASEAATYALRIAGMMITAFGLILAGFAIAYRLSAPAGAAQ